MLQPVAGQAVDNTHSEDSMGKSTKTSKRAASTSKSVKPSAEVTALISKAFVTYLYVVYTGKQPSLKARENGGLADWMMANHKRLVVTTHEDNHGNVSKVIVHKRKRSAQKIAAGIKGAHVLRVALSPDSAKVLG
jgi:hypothetical protein